jgi:hypothetical protein
MTKNCQYFIDYSKYFLNIKKKFDSYEHSIIINSMNVTYQRMDKISNECSASSRRSKMCKTPLNQC